MNDPELGRVGDVCRVGRRAVGRRRHRHRPGRRPPPHDHRQRRHGQGRRLLSGPPRKCCAPSGSPCRTGCRWSTWSIRPASFCRLQDDVFPDEDDFGRIFRNNAVISAAGHPQIAAIMGNCVAGGGYLPVLCDKLLMTDGSGLYLAGPALVKSAIGQRSASEELGGAAMHAQISGTIDYRDPTTRPAWSGCAAGRPCCPPMPEPVRPFRAWRPPSRPGRFCTIWSARPARRIRSPRRAGDACRRRGRSTNTRPNTARRWFAARPAGRRCRRHRRQSASALCGRPTGRSSSAA
jgi:hypothetical protein